MRIVYFHDSIARLGGIEKVYVDKMNYLADIYKQDIYLITTCQGDHPFVFKLSKKINHYDLSIRFHTIYKYSFYKRIFLEWKMNKKTEKQLDIILNKIDPDIIIVTASYGADIICKQKCRAKKIVESHIARIYNGKNDDVKRNIVKQLYKNWKQKKFFRIIEKKSDAIVTLTYGDAKSWNSNNVFVIPNIINMQNTNLSSLTKKTVLFAGRFTYQKGLDRMLNAWKIVCDRQKDWTLKLVGEGKLKENLIEQCKNLGIENNVVFINTTKDMDYQYINSSLFLLTSRYEGFGLVLVEAMQYGIPCISFDCPYGPSEIIDNEQNGIIVENEDIDNFANAILTLINNEEIRMSMGKAALEKSKKYLPETIMPQWIEFFHKILNKN